ncbi:hypothetical protein K440DRAFT_630890 [Wilcoxina mikolae CBS 423.85]|nr:hypothetical protein K440DRAFT_630890 [Wilcoxina mikolae CBS 423.85]
MALFPRHPSPQYTRLGTIFTTYSEMLFHAKRGLNPNVIKQSMPHHRSHDHNTTWRLVRNMINKKSSSRCFFKAGIRAKDVMHYKFANALDAIDHLRQDPSVIQSTMEDIFMITGIYVIQTNTTATQDDWGLANTLVLSDNDNDEDDDDDNSVRPTRESLDGYMLATEYQELIGFLEKEQYKIKLGREGRSFHYPGRDYGENIGQDETEEYMWRKLEECFDDDD